MKKNCDIKIQRRIPHQNWFFEYERVVQGRSPPQYFTLL